MSLISYTVIRKPVKPGRMAVCKSYLRVDAHELYGGELSLHRKRSREFCKEKWLTYGVFTKSGDTRSLHNFSNTRFDSGVPRNILSVLIEGLSGRHTTVGYGHSLCC